MESERAIAMIPVRYAIEVLMMIAAFAFLAAVITNQLPLAAKAKVIPTINPTCHYQWQNT